MRREWSLLRVGALLIGTGALAPALADELTQRIQSDLVTLGYQPGNTQGEATVDTTIAIAQFQAEHGLQVDGQASPVLAGILAAEVSKQSSSAAPAQNPVSLEEARQACLQEKIAAAEKAQRTRRGLGRMASAVNRVASQSGNHDVSRALGDAQTTVATVDDLSAAARDLGITESEVEACSNPS